MKKFSFLIFISVVVLFVTHNSCKQSNMNSTNGIISIDINYGNDSTKNYVIAWREGITVLETLQHVATVETFPVDEFVFIVSIDSVKAIRGEKAWYFKINGKSSKTLAINTIVNDGDKISWIYKKDVCSTKVSRLKKEL